MLFLVSQLKNRKKKKDGKKYHVTPVQYIVNTLRFVGKYQIDITYKIEYILLYCHKMCINYFFQKNIAIISYGFE